MDQNYLEIKKLEYTAAQDMLKHYDTLNWQIGSILIAGVVVLTGLVINKDLAELMRESTNVAWAIALAIPGTSAMILGAWWLWFQRHYELYNFRNAVMHRIEQGLGMYHYLQIAEVNLARMNPKAARAEHTKDFWDGVKRRAGVGPSAELYGELDLRGPSGTTIAGFIACLIPTVQFVLLRVLSFCEPMARGDYFEIAGWVSGGLFVGLSGAWLLRR